MAIKWIVKGERRRGVESAIPENSFGSHVKATVLKQFLRKSLCAHVRNYLSFGDGVQISLPLWFSQAIKPFPNRHRHHHLLLRRAFARYDHHRLPGDLNPIGRSDLRLLQKHKSGPTHGPGNNDRVGLRESDGKRWGTGRLNGGHNAPKAAVNREVAAVESASSGLADGARNRVNTSGARAAAAAHAGKAQLVGLSIRQDRNEEKSNDGEGNTLAWFHNMPKRMAGRPGCGDVIDSPGGRMSLHKANVSQRTTEPH